MMIRKLARYVRQLHVSPAYLLPSLAVVSSLGLLAWVWVGQWTTNILWRSYYEGLPSLGQNCAFGVGAWRDGDSLTTVRARPLALTPLPMPYRDRLGEVAVPTQGYLLVRCRLDLSFLRPTGFAELTLGPLAGDVAVFMNGELRLLQSDNGPAALSLLPQERVAEQTLEIVARPLGAQKWPGPASLIPFVASDDRVSLERLDHFVMALNAEEPLFRLGFGLAMAMIFGVAWWAGIRYPDVGWMLVINGLLGAWSFFAYRPFGSAPLWQYQLASLTLAATKTALVPFLAAFLRLRSAERPLTWLFVIATLVWAALCFWIPLDWYFLTTAALPSASAALGMLVVTWLGRRAASEVPTARRRQVRFLLGLGVVTACGLAADAAVSLTLGVNLSKFVLFAISTTYAAYLGLDLVVFHRQYFREKARRLEEEQSKELLARRLELGSAVQMLLLPAERQGRIGACEYRLFFEAAEQMAGDWLSVWRVSDQEVRLMLGDVVGKGPQAALAVAAITSVINECRTEGRSLEASILRINAMLISLFGQHITSTLAAVSLCDSGVAELYNHGGLGWLLVQPGETGFRAKHGPILGVDPGLAVNKEIVQLAPGALVACFTDGCLEGSRGVHRLIRKLKAREGDIGMLGPQELFQLVVEAGQGSVLVDDRAMIVIKSHAHERGAEAFPHSA
jgi:hypothetical protein